MSKLIQNIGTTLRAVKLIMQLEQRFMLSSIFLSIFEAITPYINIFLLTLLIDLSTKPDKQVMYVITIIFIAGLINLFLFLSISYLKKVKTYRQEQFQKNEKMMFSEKQMNMDYQSIEDNEIFMLNQKILIESQTGYNTYYVFTFFSQFIGSVVTVVIALTIIMPLIFIGAISIYLKFLFLVLFICVIVVNIKTSKKTKKNTLSMYGTLIPFNASFNFFSDYYNNYNTGKDIRLYHLEDMLFSRQEEEEAQINSIMSTTKKKNIKFEIIQNLTLGLLNSFVYLFLIYECYTGIITIGSILIYLNSMVLLATAGISLFEQTYSLMENNKYLDTYFSFLDIKSNAESGSLQVKQSISYTIELRNVSFKYPKSNEYALKNISLKISSGEKIAIVGENGSGKTTLIKLICRFYDPLEGEILLNNINIKEFDIDEYWAIIGAVFQDFKLLSFTLREIVTATNEKDTNRQQLLDSIDKVDLSDWFAKLKEKEDTYLYKDIDDRGVEISGGEAQKIALARAVYKDAPIMILDEPTAALDPKAEEEIYQLVNKIDLSRIIILVSHRLSSCIFCNKIIVMKNGEIAEEGEHVKLLGKKHGEYNNLWYAQAEYYQRNDIAN